MEKRPQEREPAPMVPADAQRAAAVIVAALPGAEAGGGDLAARLEAAAARTAPGLVKQPALVDAMHLYKAVVDPAPARGWEPVDPAVLEDVLTRALVRDPEDPVWRDYRAHVAALERARPRLGMLRVLTGRVRRPSAADEGAVRESLTALRAHRRAR